MSEKRQQQASLPDTTISIGCSRWRRGLAVLVFCHWRKDTENQQRRVDRLATEERRTLQRNCVKNSYFDGPETKGRRSGYSSSCRLIGGD
jgi:hypothetical protein